MMKEIAERKYVVKKVHASKIIYRMASLSLKMKRNTIELREYN